MKEKVDSFLEFGEMDSNGKNRKIWDIKKGFQAYEWFMLSRYFSDVCAYKKMEELFDTPKEMLNVFSGVHHKDDVTVNLGKLSAMIAVGAKNFCELGSSVFGCIEGMSFCTCLLKECGMKNKWIDFEYTNWFGVEISNIMNELAILIHPRHDITIYKSIQEMKKKCDVFFAKGISLLYAIRDEKELLNIMENNRLSVFDYSFSLKEDFFSTVGSGVPIKYISYKKFERCLEQSPVVVFVNKNGSNFNEGTVFLDIVAGSEEDVFNFILCDNLFRKDIIEKLDYKLKNAFSLKEKKDWVPLNEFMGEKI